MFAYLCVPMMPGAEVKAGSPRDITYPSRSFIRARIRSYAYPLSSACVAREKRRRAGLCVSQRNT